MGTPNSSLTYYAHRRACSDGRVLYFHASPSRFWVDLHRSTDPVVEIVVRERQPEDAPSSYWGWLDTKDPSRYTMVWPSEIQLEMCFPYGSEVSEKKGFGRKVNLVIEEKRTDAPGATPSSAPSAT